VFNTEGQIAKSLKRRLANWLQQYPPLRWLLGLSVRLWVPRHYVGAVGAVFNEAGQVLLLEHVFRPHYPWGLPGGWVEQGEHPADAVQREIEEELELRVEVKQMVLCEVQGGRWGGATPLGLGLVYYCRLRDGVQAVDLTQVHRSHEILAFEWVDPTAVRHLLSPLEHAGIVQAKQAFDREIANERTLQ
jgi:ADP-ribose pyrophosphatase YjhB (NUDIX family)